jgi:hypothetical protein
MADGLLYERACPTAHQPGGDTAGYVDDDPADDALDDRALDDLFGRV